MLVLYMALNFNLYVIQRNIKCDNPNCPPNQAFTYQNNVMIKVQFEARSFSRLDNNSYDLAIYNMFNTSYDHSKPQIKYFQHIVYDGFGRFIMMFYFCTSC